VAKGYHANYAEELANEKIRKAAIYALNRNALRKVINGSFVNENLVPQNSPSTVEYINKVDKIIEQATAEQPQNFANHDLVAFSASYEDALLDDILNKQQKQLDIINSFIEKDPGLIRTSKSQIDSPVNHIDLSAKSTKAEKDVVTESYAKILTMQGRKEKAIEVYEKLILKFPEKKRTLRIKLRPYSRKSLFT
jgi:tetratricopeptide (TPR) repeat protein